MTETASQVATAPPDEAFDHVGTVGRPLFWTDVTVVGEDGERLPPGETGEFVVGGPTVSPGYYGDPEATAEAFGEFGLHTGDVGYVDRGGRLYVLNRVDDRIITGGENVDPGEVADVLRSHPGVRDVAVVGLPDAEWGERVSALVVPETDELDRTDLEAFARERLAGFKIPRAVAFADELPRTVSGTVERDAVRERLAAREGADGEDADGGDESDEADAVESDDDGSESAEDDGTEPTAAADGSDASEPDDGGDGDSDDVTEDDSGDATGDSDETATGDPDDTDDGQSPETEN
jgi:O-succinylbenzoic acid--CoA ligase